MQKIKNIEFLRVIFMCSVLWMHVLMNLDANFPSSIFQSLNIHGSNGGKAVDGFFIISGFLLYITFKNSTSVIDFVKKKIIRLQPVILFAIIVSGIASIFGLIKFDIHSAIIQLTFTNMLTDSTKGVWNYLNVLWYVSVLFWVSLFYFYIMKIFDKKYANLIIGISTVTAYFIALHIHGGSFAFPLKTYNNIFNMGILRGFGGIGLGYFLGLYYKENYQNIVNCSLNLKQKLLYTLAELLLLILVVAELMFVSVNHSYNLSLVILIFTLITLFILKRGYISKFFDNDLSVFLGRYTYSIYIIHLVSFAIMKKFVKTLPANYFTLFGILFILILLGVFTYHFVEVPCTKLFKNILFNKDKTSVKETN